MIGAEKVVCAMGSTGLCLILAFAGSLPRKLLAFPGEALPRVTSTNWIQDPTKRGSYYWRDAAGAARHENRGRFHIHLIS